MSPASKKKTTKKQAANKTASKKKAAKKTVAVKKASNKAPAKKTVAKKKVATKKVSKKAGTQGKAKVTPEQRLEMIAVAAYLKAEKRGFAAGYELDDWNEAEKEVDASLSS